MVQPVQTSGITSRLRERCETASLEKGRQQARELSHRQQQQRFVASNPGSKWFEERTSDPGMVQFLGECVWCKSFTDSRTALLAFETAQ